MGLGLGTADGGHTEVRVRCQNWATSTVNADNPNNNRVKASVCLSHASIVWPRDEFNRSLVRRTAFLLSCNPEVQCHDKD